MQSGFVEQQDERLLCESARQDDALFFAAGDFVHPAITEMLSADLRQGLFSDGEVFVFFEPQRAAVGMSSLQDIVAGHNRKNERTFLLHERNALSASAYVQMAGLETVKFDAPGKRRCRPGD